ncbi:MAG: PEGA domain-containing protein [Firmicutes bacterium]|nr:PEGA domain-containing protein [Bacillota bacterium]
MLKTKPFIALMLITLVILSGCKILRETGTLTIQSTPTNPLVLIETEDGYISDYHSLSFTLDSGPYRVRLFSNGYQPYNKNVFIQPGKTSIIETNLEPLTRKGFLEITSDLGNAFIWLDADFYGFTKSSGAVSLLASPGVYNLRLKKESFEYEREITITENETSFVDFKGQSNDKFNVTVTVDFGDAELFYWHDKNPEKLDYPTPKSLGRIEKDAIFQFEDGGIYWFYAKKPGRVFSSEMVVLSSDSLVTPISLTSAPVSEVRKTVNAPLASKTFFAPWELEDFVRSQNGNPYQIYIAKYYLYYGKEIGLSGDLAYVQSIHETGFFKFGGDVVPEQNNYAGIGAVGGGAKGHFFNTPEEGVLGQFQHLYAYACDKSYDDPIAIKNYSSKPSFWNKIVDPRYHLVNKGSAPLLANLSGRWAVDSLYATKIIAVYDRLLDYLKY